MRVTSVVTWLMTVAVVVAGESNVDIDDILIKTFGTPPPIVDDVPATLPEVVVVAQPEEDCVCLPYYQCKNENGVGVIDVRFLSTCSDILEQCCKHENIIPHAPPTPFTTHPTQDPHAPCETTSTPAPSAGCGIRNKKGVVFQLVGTSEGEANFAEFPWMTAVMGKNDGQVHCGGSLIHLQVVLTAAHCLENLDCQHLTVRAGEWNMEATSEPYAYQERDVDHIIMHEEYLRSDVRNDVALVFLKTPFDAAPHVGVVCLPSQDQSVDNSKCLVMGWGTEKFEHPNFKTKILKSVELPIIPRDPCLHAFRSTRLGQYFTLHESFICAGGEEGKDACTGDGGGPLVCPAAIDMKASSSGDINVRILNGLDVDQERYMQAGIVAWGIGCGQKGVPGAYASVAMFRHWIDNKMTLQKLGTDSYTVPYDST